MLGFPNSVPPTYDYMPPSFFWVVLLITREAYRQREQKFKAGAMQEKASQKAGLEGPWRYERSIRCPQLNLHKNFEKMPT